MSETDTPKKNKHIASPFIPDILEQGSESYPAIDIFANGIRESAGGYVTEHSQLPVDMVPTIEETFSADDASPTHASTPPSVESIAEPVDHEMLEEVRKSAYAEGRQAAIEEVESKEAAFIEAQQQRIEEVERALKEATEILKKQAASLESEVAHASAALFSCFFHDYKDDTDSRVKLLHNVIKKEILPISDRLRTKPVITVSPIDKKALEELLSVNNDVYSVKEDETQSEGTARIDLDKSSIHIDPEIIIHELKKLLTNK